MKKNLTILITCASLLFVAKASALNYYADVDSLFDSSGVSSTTGGFDIANADGDGLNLLDPMGFGSVLDAFYNTDNYFVDTGTILDPLSIGSGYDALSETITRAWAVFEIYDDLYNPVDTLTIELAGSSWADGNQLFDLGFYTGIVGGSITGDILTNLDANGALNYSISATGENFYVGKVALLAETDTCDSQSVPDTGSTFALLGLSVFGLVAFRRNRATR